MEELTDNEKRDIISLIEQGKPLPDRFRFALFNDKREVELVWNGKTRTVTNVVLPFQTIEHVDEPRAEENAPLELFDTRGRQITGWTNKLIWGDNKLILSSLVNGPLRKEIEAAGGLKLIYIDPPFDVGADFTTEITFGEKEESFTKEANILEEIAYRDTWGKGADSFIAMIYERLRLMRDLLADDGSIYVHCDWRVSGYLRLVMDEVFGKENFQRDIVWNLSGVSGYKSLVNSFVRGHETVFYYSKTQNPIFNKHYLPYSEAQLKRFSAVDENGRRYKPITKTKRIYLDEAKGVPISDVWSDIASFQTVVNSSEILDYPTQKPEKLLERIIKASSNEGDLVADFFCGSGTTMAVAEKLGRKWIGADLGKFGIHTTRKRMIGIQRALKEDGKDYRAFEILNLGKYEREHYIGINPSLGAMDKATLLAQREADFVTLILKAYQAQALEGFKCFVGRKDGRLVAIGPVNLPVSRLFVEELLLECRENRIHKVDVLGFEFEMGLFPNVQEEAREKGIDLRLKYIPREVFDKRAIEKNQVAFYDVAYIEVKTETRKDQVRITLTDFSVFYSQDNRAETVERMKKNSRRVIVENGKILAISKDAKGNVNKPEVLTKKWTDWIDYWSVDFDYESKKENVHGLNPETGKEEVTWTGDYVFENEWQSFRTKRDRSLELKTPWHDFRKGAKIAVKVIDIFGNDTMKVVTIK